MRKDTSFLERKLTEAEFSEKYWRSGALQYQYHTGTIDDGRDEREQFLFNNCRALYELMRQSDMQQRKVIATLSGQIEVLEKRLDALLVGPQGT